MREPGETIEKIIDRAGVAILCYLDEEGYPMGRAMLAPRERQGVKTFWFTSNYDTNKVARYEQDPRASVYFYDRRYFRGVSLRGVVEIVKSREMRARIWRFGDAQYYPRGVDDPDYCVLKFTADKVRFFDEYQSADFDV